MTQNPSSRSHKYKTNLCGNAYSCSYCLHMPSINWYCLDNTLTIFLITPFKTSLLYNLSWKSNTWYVMLLAFTKYLYMMYNVHLLTFTILLTVQRETEDYTPLQRWATNSQTNSHNLKKLNWIYLQCIQLIVLGRSRFVLHGDNKRCLSTLNNDRVYTKLPCTRIRRILKTEIFLSVLKKKKKDTGPKPSTGCTVFETFLTLKRWKKR